MRWPDLNSAFNQVPLPEGYRYAQVRRGDVPALRAASAAWYPDVSVEAAGCYLEQGFYETPATLAGEAERDLLIVLIWKQDELAGFAIPLNGPQGLERCSSRSSRISSSRSRRLPARRD
jgi:hypothetical protein